MGKNHWGNANLNYNEVVSHLSLSNYYRNSNYKCWQDALFTAAMLQKQPRYPTTDK
jgi:hypothetical protein